MLFEYKAKSVEGKRVKGELNATDRASALNQIKELNLTPLNLKEVGGDAPKSWLEIEVFEKDITKYKFKPKKLLGILNQMAIMMKAGVSMPFAMEVLVNQEKERKVKQILISINDDMLTGIPFSKAMSKFQAFPKIITNMITAGEANGRLDVAFEMAATNLSHELEIKGKIKSAMAYPSLLLAMTAVLLFILNTTVLPVFANVFKQLNTPLPLITRFVMGTSAFCTTYWYIVLGLPALAVAAYFFARYRYPEFVIKSDGYKLQIPIFGQLNKQTLTARFCRILASLVNAGVDIYEAFSISRDVITNQLMVKHINGIIEDVKVGLPIHKSILRQHFFAPLLVSMVRVGEETGMLGEVLNKMANMYELETDNATKQLTALMEPAMTIIIAGIVGTVVISMVAPMFGMYTAIAG